MNEQTKEKTNRGISPIWILPLTAIAICGWLLYKSYLESGVMIDVYFKDATGITPEKTQVMHIGIPLGIVKKLVPDLDRNEVKAEIRMDRHTEKYLVEDTAFWLVKPEVAADRITGLDTILTGSYIGMQKGESSQESETFTALTHAPPIPKDSPGLHIQLRSSGLRSIQAGSSIFFKNIKIGAVQTYTLQPDESILLDCYIEPEYSHLIHKGSRFYDSSGVTFSGKLTDLKVRMESLSSLLIGGIVVSSPNNGQTVRKADNGDVFPLYEDYDASKYGLSMTLKLASGQNITEGITKVMYRGLEAGYVDHISINDDPERSVTAHILLDPRASLILKQNTRFWLVSPSVSLAGVKNISTLLAGTYITFQPGDGDFRDAFEILPEPPLEKPLRPGQLYRLESPDLSSATAGTPVYFKRVQIGEIIGVGLSDDHDSVERTVFIYDNYTNLIRKDTVFIETSNITVKASASGISLSSNPLLGLLRGGVGIMNNEDGEHETAAEQSIFRLYPDTEAAASDHPWLRKKGVHLTLTADGQESYRVGTPILYKKLKIGEITGAKLDGKGQQILFDCRIDTEHGHLITTSSRFYDSSGVRLTAGKGGVTVETGNLETIVNGGISFITPAGGKKVRSNTTFAIHPSLAAARNIDNHKVRVTFTSTDTLSEGAAVKYKGIEIGEVSDLAFTKDMNGIEAELSVFRQYRELFNEGTQIWLAKPKINLSGMKNLETILFGAYVAIHPGSGKPATRFVGSKKPPELRIPNPPGLNLILEAKSLNSITIGSPVYYRRVQVGEVTGYDLSFDFKDVLIYINIKQKYTPIVHQNTRFWNASGLRVDGGLFSGISISTQSLNSVMAGGIAFATPEGVEMGTPVSSGYQFPLHAKAEKQWLDWSPDIFTITEEEGSLPKWGL